MAEIFVGKWDLDYEEVNVFHTMIMLLIPVPHVTFLYTRDMFGNEYLSYYLAISL